MSGFLSQNKKRNPDPIIRIEGLMRSWKYSHQDPFLNHSHSVGEYLPNKEIDTAGCCQL